MARNSLSGSRKKRILVVEDDVVYRRSLYKALSKNHYDVFVAESFCEASELAEQLPFALLIVDIRNPQVNGLNGLIGIQKKTPGAKIIIMSTFEEKAFVQFPCCEHKAIHLVKPIKRQTLLHAVEDALHC